MILLYILLSCVFVYIIACAVIKKYQYKLLYKPDTKIISNDFSVVLKSNTDDVEIMGWVDNPGSEKAIIYYGGSSEIVEMRREKLALFFPNYTRYIVPYRGFGPNKDLNPNEALLKSDALNLFNFVNDKHERVNILGRSLGTSIASHVAANSLGVSKIALITPFYSVLSIAKHRHPFFPIGKLMSDWHEVWRDAQKIEIPVMACISKFDKITPTKFWHMLHDYFPNKPFEFWDDADHSEIAYSDKMWESISCFFEDDFVINFNLNAVDNNN